MDVEFYFDPVCAWARLASDWLVEVAPDRGLRLNWRGYSKLLAERTKGLADDQLLTVVAAHRALRVLESVRDAEPDAVGRLYDAFARLAAEDRAAGRPALLDARRALQAAGLDPAHADAAWQERWDEAIARSTEEVHLILGDEVPTPAVIIGQASPVGFACPRVSPMPTGADALALWDARVTLAGRLPAKS